MEKPFLGASNLMVPISGLAVHETTFDRGKLQVPDQIMNAHAESVCNNFQCVNGHVALAALDFPDMGTVEAGAVGEDILGPSPLQPRLPNDRADFFLNLLHSSQFASTLVKSIQVISCKKRGLFIDRRTRISF